MKKQTQPRIFQNEAFTLIEMLVVITIIGILAAIIIPIAGTASRSAKLNMATAQRAQIESAIAAYKAQKGYYPPDNQNRVAPPLDPFAVNQLFYELTGTVYTNQPPLSFVSIHARTMDGGVIAQTAVSSLFGVGGFANSAYVADPANNADVQQSDARDFLPSLESKYYSAFVFTGNRTNIMLGLPVDGPVMYDTINPWSYNSSNPTNNPDSYDLWIILQIGKKKYQISNWSSEPQPLD